MYRKFALLLSLVFLFGYTPVPMVTTLPSTPPPPACSQGSASAYTCTGTGSGDTIGSNAFGDSFTTGASISSYGITVGTWNDSGTTTFELRIGTSSDLSSYLATTTITVDSTDSANNETGAWSGGCITLNASTTYYIGAVAISGTSYWRQTTYCSGMPLVYPSSGWTMDSTDTYATYTYTILLNGG